MSWCSEVIFEHLLWQSVIPVLISDDIIGLDAFPKGKGSLLRKLGFRSKGESSLSPILFELWSVFSPSSNSETTDICFSDGSANTMKLLDRGNSSGLCSSHAAVQNATTDGRARGFTETTRVKRVQAFSASSAHPCLYRTWCQRINHLNDSWKLLAGGVVFLGSIKHLETLERQSKITCVWNNSFSFKLLYRSCIHVWKQWIPSK